MLPLMPIMVTMDIPATMVDTVDTTVTDLDTADTTADTGRGKPRPNPLPPLRPIPPPMLGTDTTVVVTDTDTVWDTADTTDTLVLMDTTAVTGRGKPRLSPRLMLKPVPMPGTDTTDTHTDGVDTTVWDTTVVLMDTDTTVVTGNFPTPKSHLSFRNENIF